jgi:hypothetical protein
MGLQHASLSRNSVRLDCITVEPIVLDHVLSQFLRAITYQ